MWRRFLYLFPILLILASIGVSFMQPTVAADSPNANKYCQSHAPQLGKSGKVDQKGIPACVAAYNSGFDNKSLAAVCPSALDGFPSAGTSPSPASTNGTAFGQCQTYWIDGQTAAGRAPNVPGAGSRGGAQPSACENVFSGDYLNACNTGFGKSSGALDSACTDQKSPAYNACVDGFAFNGGDTGQGGTNRGNEFSQAAQDNCTGKTGSDQTACLQGYDGQTNGKSEATACQSFAGSDLATCKTNWEKAKAAADAGATKSLGCTAQFSDPLTWIICPVVSALSQIINWVDGLITNQLNVKTAAIFCSSQTCNAYYTAWSSFRDLALGIMAIVGLILIISQALGLEILDAYTIRKGLPRLLIAAVAITLSWPLMQFLIQLSDDLGFGVRNLIYAPFSSLGDSVDLSFGGGVANQFLGLATGVGGAAAAIPIWILAGGLGALLAYAGTAALAVFVAIVVLILRQVAIILLMLLSPLALVAYILPNTQRVYRMWWESFSKALLMFPLIAAFIATGRVFSAVAVHNGGALNQLIGFAAYFAPYFMIPLTFRMAGSTVGAMGNFVQGRAAGGFSALGNYRKGKRQERLARGRGQGLYNKGLVPFNHPWKKNADGTPMRTSVGKMLNTVGLYTLDADERIPQKLGSTRARGGWNVPGFRRGAARDAARIDAARREQTRKALQEVSPGYKGGRLMAGLYKGTEHDYLKDLPPDARAELDKKFGVGTERDEKGYLVNHRMAENWGQRQEAAAIFAQSTNPDVREGASELASASEMLEQYNL